MAGVANESIALEALNAWGIEAPQIRLIKERENAVYSVEDRSGHRYALKLHRYGYHTDQELLAEYSWIAALNESGLRVPQPLASIEGSPLVHVAFEDRHHQLDLVPWIEAEPLATVSTDDAGPDELRRIYTELGRLAARVPCSPGSGRFRQDFPERPGTWRACWARPLCGGASGSLRL